MKLSSLIMISGCACIMSGSYPCAAAFPLGSRQEQAVKNTRNISDSLWVLHKVQNTVMQNGRYFPDDKTQAPELQQKGGGFGSAALICGVLGIWPAAIILEIIGMSKGRANRHLARAGLILGIVQAVFFLFILILLVLIA